MKTEQFLWNGYSATVISPERPNGKWIWKTEFLYAFDKAEQKLCEDGYTRVYYQISNMYGCYKAVRLMHEFYSYVVQKYCLDPKCNLFGFSRGGLYAFNFALFYPECVEKIYLDAPVLDLRTWPKKDCLETAQCYREMLQCYHLSDETLLTFDDMPINNLENFFKNKIPLLLIAGDADTVVPFEKNAKKVIEYCEKNGIELEHYVKIGCQHHPHSLENVEPILRFIENNKKH